MPTLVVPQNLLVVDDERAQLKTLHDIFTDEGFEVCACATSEEALERCRDQLFAVVILDLRLHGQDQDGIELLSRLRQLQPGIHVIIHTAYGSFNSAKDAVNVGAFAYIEKMGDPADLVSQVHRAVKEQLAEALTASELRYRDLLNDMVAIVWEFELPTWRFTFVSEPAESILGYSVEQWRDDPDFWVEHIHVDDRERRVQICEECTARGEDHECDYRAIAADGRIVWLRDIVHVVKDESGTPIKLRGVMFDVTEKQLAEEARRESEARYRSLVGDAPVCIHEIDLDGRLQSINPAGFQMLGAKSAADVVGREYLSFVVDTDRARIEALMQRAFQGEASAFEFTCYVGGQARLFGTNFIPVVSENGSVGKLMGTTEDITDRRSAEVALRESEHSLAKAQQIAQMGNWQYDLETGQLTGSAEMFRIVGLSDGESASTFESFVNEFVHPDDRDVVARSCQDALTTSQPEALEFRLARSSDQAACYVRAEAKIISGANGSPQKVIGTLQDISGQKHAELALRESEEKFRVLTEKSAAIVLIARAERIVYCNPMAAALTRYSRDELTELSFLDFIHPEYRDLVAERHRGRLRGESQPNRYEIKILTKHGEDCWLDLSAQLIEYKGSPAVLVTGVNITERKRSEKLLGEMQAQLSHVSRLSTMGEMVAGIAHELNQPLSAIANFSVACKNTLNATNFEYDVPIATWLEDVHDQSLRCGDIIRGLRDFVTKSGDDWQSVDLNRVVRDSIAIIGSDLCDRSVVIDCRLPNPGPQVQANRIQLQQVLVNLLRNACDATNTATVPEISVDVECEDGRIRLTVADNGLGVEESQRMMLFDAFYTTKPEGMGMGLAISKSIVEAHGGSLRFEPGIPSGSKFHVELPTVTTIEIEEHVGCRIN